MSKGLPLAMPIGERLSVFDSWLTGRIREAHAGAKDLAFRDLPPEDQVEGVPWEYSLMEPGARSPQGEGWSVYRFSGLRPPGEAELEAEAADPQTSGRRSVFGAITDAVLGRGPKRN